VPFRVAGRGTARQGAAPGPVCCRPPYNGVTWNARPLPPSRGPDPRCRLFTFFRELFNPAPPPDDDGPALAALRLVEQQRRGAERAIRDFHHAVDFKLSVLELSVREGAGRDVVLKDLARLRDEVDSWAAVTTNSTD
jgi:hypothetical protein